MRRHLFVLAAAVLAMSAVVAAGGGIPPVEKRPALRDIPSDVPGQFSTSWSWVKELYRGEKPAPVDSAAARKR